MLKPFVRLIVCTFLVCVGMTLAVEGQEANPGPATPKQAASTEQSLNFQTDLFTGRFSYGIPIEVPQGRGGLQPSLGLNYSSAGGNGWCGVGWSLEPGCIVRRTDQGVPIKRASGGSTWDTAGSFLNEYDDSYGFDISFGGIDTIDFTPVEF